MCGIFGIYSNNTNNNNLAILTECLKSLQHRGKDGFGMVLLDRNKFKEFWINRSDHVTASLPLERWDTYSNEKHPSIKDPCENLWDRMYIWFDGKVNPCDADYKSYLSYGNYNKANIKEIWNSKIISKLRDDHLKGGRNNIQPCDRCGVTFQ